MNKVIIAFGSNIEPEKNVTRAKEILAKEQTILAESKVLKTKPQGYTNQADFLNGAILIETELELKQLKLYLKDIEKQLGRVKTKIKDGPRTMDLDIIVFNGEIVDKHYEVYDFVQETVDELLKNNFQ